MIASFFAAYMSTIDTHLNWGASYLVNDVYKRFIKPEATQRHYIVASMVFTVFLAVLGMLVTTLMHSIREGWYIITSISGGVTIIYILRWYWWRINAWSEIAAMVSALVCTVVFRLGLGPISPCALLRRADHRRGGPGRDLPDPTGGRGDPAFYRRIRPGGRLWRPIARQVPGADRDPAPIKAVPAFVLSVIAIYCALFGRGQAAARPTWLGALLLLVCAVSGWLVWRYVAGLSWGKGPERSGTGISRAGGFHG